MRGYAYPGYHTFGSFFGLGYGWYGLLELIILGILIFAVFYFLFKNNTRKYQDYYIPKKQTGEKNEALKILNEKFVKGEIDEEEYLRKRKLIED
ncbi:putative membrane protein [Marinitoga hydrogenitolerans DSM 16785]|uniref:Membrane protein n=1 Tax=Marinitoga hydrogenitolerans (strain DSM 16785 / JCM 12826 / AT1271) TaxID=1122195 RepID=A0A1M4W3E1_MARH1|nr:SHOCT domain-containing protein [Marinitoga hydrogenitolerans]SHE75736.1 putative membrane protein [Marinitoga hydrogenitolerans DSM 16785]